ncbi:hypothetical protein CWI36_0480p0020 [Hamiltosporidium magnivora]|uniref:Uncharacterized protein n=1 Tax=Hamiltosporidium magnivora TaxID=148818 RepID=A0A4Q9LE95_9MICR|nr:hypothetical protein CWI36_0480p0020 [Hamiltosporidium magnivora]
MGGHEFISRIFLSFPLILYFLTEYSEEKMYIAKYRKFFAKKCHKIYKRETKEFVSLPSAIDFAHLIFSQETTKFAIESISNYLQCGISTKYEFRIYNPYEHLDGKLCENIFRTFQLNRIKNEWWSIIFYSEINALNLDILRKNHIIVRKEFLKYFLKCFFLIYTAVKKQMKYLNINFTRYSYISINDIMNDVSKEISQEYQNIPLYLFPDQYEAICIKIFSQNAISNAKIDKENLINRFNRLFHEYFSRVFYGVYINFIIDISKSELHEGSNLINTIHQTIINNYRLVFDDTQNLENDRMNDLRSERAFLFENSYQVLKFYYFYTTKDTKHSDYKFYILFRRNAKKFEFNYRWYNDFDYQDRIAHPLFYMEVLCPMDLYLIEFVEDECKKSFKIHKIRSPTYKLQAYNNYKFVYRKEIITINCLLDRLIFYQNQNYL